MIVFNALDFRLPLDEERKLSRPLESLIEGMTSAYLCEDEEEESSQTADEGIEQDSGEDEDQDILSHQLMDQDGKGKRGMSLLQVMEVRSHTLILFGRLSKIIFPYSVLKYELTLPDKLSKSFLCIKSRNRQAILFVF